MAMFGTIVLMTLLPKNFMTLFHHMHAGIMVIPILVLWMVTFILSVFLLMTVLREVGCMIVMAQFVQRPISVNILFLKKAF